MKDSFFSTKRYQGIYVPIYRFKEFGDVNNYWIQLSYVCNRDDWHIIKSQKGTPLDLELTNQDGEKIFGNIPESHLKELRTRNYILGGNSEPEPFSEDESLIQVVETYVYAPSKTYTIYDSDIVSIWGMKDTDYATQSNIIYGTGAGNVFRNQFYQNTILQVEDVSKFATGDYVITHIKCQFGFNNTINIKMHYDAWVESTPQKIIRKQGNFIELENVLNWNILDEKYVDYSNHNIADIEKFFKVLNGEEYDKNWDQYLTLKPIVDKETINGGTTIQLVPELYVMRAYSTREKKQRECITRENISFHTSYPDLSQLKTASGDKIEIFIPQQETGLECDSISRETVMTPKKWREKIKNGHWFVYAEPNIHYDAESNIYELRYKESPCR